MSIRISSDVSNSSVYDNAIERNKIGVELFNYGHPNNGLLGAENTVYSNNMIDNTQQVQVDNEAYNTYPSYSGNGTSEVSWDNGTIGNYWSDYLSKYPNATEVDHSGVGNVSYVINRNNLDIYPLMSPINLASPVSSGSIRRQICYTVDCSHSERFSSL